MKKFVLFFLIITVSLFAILYVGSSFVFDAAVDKVAPRLLPQLAERGINIDTYEYASIKIRPPRTVTIQKLSTSFELALPHQEQKLPSFFYAERVNFHITHLKNPAVVISCDNFQLYVDRSHDFPGTSFGRFDHGFISLRDPIQLSDPRAGLKNVLQKLSDIFNEKEMDPNVIVRAQVTLKVRDKEAQAYLYTVRDDRSAALRFEEKDIRIMADTFELELSDEEVAIIAKYPLRAPLIMRITSDAKESSRQAHRGDPSVPEDAYRHVLWSYLLTQKFGETFAEQVTDAHETLPTNTAAERKMDFSNNRVGREYAKRGVSRDRILWLVRNDRNVIRHPLDAKVSL
ncbi:hypothetical protein EH223_17220 [candidate division KSB1 bacterium]|nr:hypothetical protein [candidate division KSB1 bacterium]RQW00891.1 MAG: hypothetical protein EH223_17220 [candidate division KSB1 bacterium]